MRRINATGRRVRGKDYLEMFQAHPINAGWFERLYFQTDSILDVRCIKDRVFFHLYQRTSMIRRLEFRKQLWQWQWNDEESLGGISFSCSCFWRSSHWAFVKYEAYRGRSVVLAGIASITGPLFSSPNTMWRCELHVMRTNFVVCMISGEMTASDAM